MRILGFSRKWGKLKQPEFTTFRFTRRDWDWQEGEIAQVVYKPRSKEREILGVAEIIKKDKRWIMRSGINVVTEIEAQEDGFRSVDEMVTWISHTHHARNFKEPMNKLTLRWLSGQTTKTNS